MQYMFEVEEKIASCEDCPMLDAEQGCYCQLLNKMVRKSPVESAIKPNDCPLIPITYDKCSLKGCKEIRHAKGYCRKHYDQIRKHGYITE